MSLNKVFLVGNLGHDPELKSTKNGKSFCRINIATNERSVNTEGEDFEKTTWHMIHVFGKQAEWACQRLHKGARVFVEARIEKNVEESEGGEKKTQHFLRAHQLTAFSPVPTSAMAPLDTGPGGNFIVPNA
ncbi:MAG: single-stranded DNA-binding protein [Bdellovibrionota bacterium]